MDGFTFALGAIGIIVLAAVVIVTLAFKGSLSATVKPSELSLSVSPSEGKQIEKNQATSIQNGE